jgi:hypothetical protein
MKWPPVRRAFHEETDLATMAAVIAKDHTPVRQIASGVPPALERIIDSCLRKKRADRWQSMGDVKLLLASALADLDLASPRVSVYRRWPALVLAAGAAVLAAGATWWLLHPVDSPTFVPVLRRVTNTAG